MHFPQQHLRRLKWHYNINKAVAECVWSFCAVGKLKLKKVAWYKNEQVNQD